MTVHASSHHTVAPHLPSGLRLLEACRHMSHHPVAAHRTDGRGTLLATRTGGRSCAIMAFMTIITA